VFLLFIRELYSEDPLFENTKVIYSVFDNGYEGMLSDSIVDKLLFEKLESSDLTGLKNLDVERLYRFAISYSDAVIQASQNMNKDLINSIENSGKPFLKYPGNEDYEKSYLKFYDDFINEEEEIEA